MSKRGKEAKKFSRSEEDYLEVIYILSQKKGYARVGEIAKALDVKPPSVTQMVRKLSEKGLVFFERYGKVELTEKGREVAGRVIKRHALLKNFLVALGLDDRVAEEDACAMEHILHEETVETFKRMAEFLMKAPPGLKCLKCIRQGQYLCLEEG